MNKEKLLARLSEIANELATPEADIEALETETRQIETELSKLELRGKILENIKNGAEARKVDGADPNPDESEAEKRGKALKELRATTITANDIVLPKHSGNTINPTFNVVSNVIGMVDTTYVKGGESFEQPYIKNLPTGTYTAEGAEKAETDPEFGYAKINKTKITAYAEISKEMQKLPNADYEAVVRKAMGTALRRKIAAEIFIGDGTAGHFNGIFYNPTEKNIIETITDLDIGEITNTTLDEIVFAYGGDEDVEGGASCVLFLSKKDLAAFAKLRGTDKRKLHDIKINGNSGTIDTVPFVINSACGSISDAGTAEGAYCMAYGYVKNYKNVVFSDVEIAHSTDYKFRQGMVCYSGEVYIGGNVVAHNGFIRVKKGTA